MVDRNNFIDNDTFSLTYWTSIRFINHINQNKLSKILNNNINNNQLQTCARYTDPRGV